MTSSSASSKILGGLGPDVVQTYQSIRYSKMFQATTRPAKVLNMKSLVQSLIDSVDQSCNLRIHYYTLDQNQSLTGPISASLFQSFLKYARPFSCELVFKDDRSEVFDIGFAKDLLSIFLTDGKILSLLEQATLIELCSNTDPKINVSFLGNDSVHSLPITFLRTPNSYARPAISYKEPPPE